MNKRLKRTVVRGSAILSIYVILNLSNVFFVEKIYTSGVRKLRNKVVKVITDVPNNVVEITTSKELMCRGKGVKLLEKTSIEQNLDFRNTGPFKFLEHYKNPCFYRNVTYLNSTALKNPVLSFRCVPYFFIIGMPKSGTTDIWHGLSNHPGVTLQHDKEPMFFNRRRYPQANWTIDRYLDHFHASSLVIQRSPSPDIWTRDKLYFYQVTGEGTVDVSHDNNRWREVPGNEGCNEPRILNSHYLYHLNPKMKLIFMMRNPIDRVFSDYLYESQFFGYNKTVQDFHIAVLQSMSNHFNCRKYFTERGCAYNSSLETFKARLRVGMYYIFLEDWFRVFPKEQIMVIQFEEFVANRLGYLKKVFQFLELRPLTVNEEMDQVKRKIPNTRSKKDRKIGDMLYKTRRLLSQFYSPFNIRLSKLLNDDKYLWLS